MITTSDEAFEEYQRLKLIEEKLEKGNCGLNLLNSSKFNPDYYISIKKIEKRTLVDSREWLVVNTNLPFADNWRYFQDEVGVEEFLGQLKEWVSIPRFEFFLRYNRKRDNQVSSWNLPSFRKRNIEFSEIKFSIGKEAEHKVKLEGYDIMGTIKDLISKQRESTKEESFDFKNFKLLLEKKGDLDRQKKPTSNYGYGYNEKKDSSIPFLLDDKTYNSKLQVVEKEMKKLCKKYNFLELPTFYYVEIKKIISLKSWKKKNEEEMREDWDSEDTEKDSYDGNFDSYLEERYNLYLEYGED